MKRLAWAIVVALVVSMGAYQTSKAAPIAPIPEAANINSDNVIRAYYYHRHYYRHRAPPLLPIPLASPLLSSSALAPSSLAVLLKLPCRACGLVRQFGYDFIIWCNA
jgi:hypothetical protein